jgi:hypothetical protein
MRTNVADGRCSNSKLLRAKNGSAQGSPCNEVRITTFHETATRRSFAPWWHRPRRSSYGKSCACTQKTAFQFCLNGNVPIQSGVSTTWTRRCSLAAQACRWPAAHILFLANCHPTTEQRQEAKSLRSEKIKISAGDYRSGALAQQGRFPPPRRVLKCFDRQTYGSSLHRQCFTCP